MRSFFKLLSGVLCACFLLTGCKDESVQTVTETTTAATTAAALASTEQTTAAEGIAGDPELKGSVKLEVNDAKLTIHLETNAPDGTDFTTFISCENTGNQEIGSLLEHLITKDGGSVKEVDIPDGWSGRILVLVNLVMDRTDCKQSADAIATYGSRGEKVTGDLTYGPEGMKGAKFEAVSIQYGVEADAEGLALIDSLLDLLAAVETFNDLAKEADNSSYEWYQELLSAVDAIGTCGTTLGAVVVPEDQELIRQLTTQIAETSNLFVGEFYSFLETEDEAQFDQSLEYLDSLKPLVGELYKEIERVYK